MRSIFTQLGFQAVEPTTGDVTTFLRDVAAPAPSLPPG
jgi:hypothetical protein